MRPTSIVRFEWVYLAIILIGIIDTALSWNDVMATVQMQRMIAQLGAAAAYVPVVIGLLIQFALLYFIGRRGSVVAKWIFVVLTGFGIASACYGLATHTASTPLLGVLGVVLLVLDAIAIWLLFRPDTRPWFGETVA